MERDLSWPGPSPAGILILSADGRILAADARAAHLLGCESPEELRDAALSDRIPDPGQAQTLRRRMAASGSDGTQPLECVIERLDGARIPVELSLLTLGENRVCSLRAADSPAPSGDFQRLYREMRDAFVIVDMQGRILECNSAYLELVGYTRQELAHLTYQDLTPSFWHPIEDEIVRAQVLGRGYSDLYEKEYRRKDGQIISVELRTILRRDEHGQPEAMWAIIRDVSDRKRAEEALRRSEQTSRAILDASLASIFLIDPQGIIQTLNESAARRLGRIRDELLGVCSFDLFPPGVAESRRKQIAEVARSGRMVRYEDERQGIWFDNQIHPIFDEHGQVTRLVIIAYDISDRKKAELGLRESEQRYRTLAEFSPDSIFIIDRQGKILYVNKHAAAMAGSPPERMAGAEPTQFFDEKARHIVLEDIQRVVNSGQPIETDRSFIFPSGEHWMNTWLVPLMDIHDEVYAVLGVSRDLTNSKRIEKALRESEEINRVILNASQAAAWMIKPDGLILAVNQAGAQYFHLDPAAIVGKNISEIFSAEVTEERRQTIENVIRLRQTLRFEDHRSGIWFDTQITPILSHDGQVDRLVIIAFEVTDRVLALQALAASEERYRSLAEAAQDYIFIIDRKGILQYVNTFAAAMLGKHPGEIIGKRTGDFLPSERIDAFIQATFQKNQAGTYEDSTVIDGHEFWLSFRLVPLLEAGDRPHRILGIARDITEQKKNERLLMQASQLLETRVQERTADLEAARHQLRQLTARLIKAQEQERLQISRELHDDAGPLLISLKYSLSAMLEDVGPTHSQEQAKRLHEAIKLVDETITHIRSLSRSLRPPGLEVSGLNIALKDFCHEFSARTRLQIRYQGEEIPGLPDNIAISLYRFVQEALTNVMRHAQASRVAILLKRGRGEITLSVTDNGRGLNESEPTDGIGLLGIRERMALLDGYLKIQPGAGKGTRLTAHIPWRPEQDTKREEKHAKPAHEQTRRGRKRPAADR